MGKVLKIIPVLAAQIRQPGREFLNPPLFSGHPAPFLSLFSKNQTKKP
jgi:hypothetical protein